MLFTVFYFADVFLRASEKYFWYDELFTVYFCRLPNLHALWDALHQGVDFNPPPFYLITQASESLFGEGLIATRLPEMIGFWILCLCLFRFVEYRAGAIAGSIAMVFPLFTGAFYYAYEARPFGLVLGFCGLALVCWQMSLENPRQLRWLIGFSASLLAAFMMHCFALLITAPFAAFELFRNIRLRRLDSRRWFAMIAPAACACVLYLSLLRSFGSLAKGTDFVEFSPPEWIQVAYFYDFLLVPCILIPLLALVLPVSENTEGVWRSLRDPAIPVPEFFIAVTFLTLPFLGIFLERLVRTPVEYRYVLSALVGMSIIISLISRSKWATLTMAVVLYGVAGMQFARLVSHRYHGRVEALQEPSSGFSMNIALKNPLENYSLLVSNARGSLPIGILHPLDFLYLVHYAPKLRDHLYYIQGAPNDFFFHGYEHFRPLSPINYNPVVTRQQLLRSSQDCLIYGMDQVSQLQPFVELGAKLKWVKVSNGHFLADVAIGTS